MQTSLHRPDEGISWHEQVNTLVARCCYDSFISTATTTSTLDGQVRRVGSAALYPLEQIHPFAAKAALASICADQQGQFWDMHNALFAKQTELDEASLKARARSLKLDGKRFDSCLQSTTLDKVHADVADGNTLSVSGTPTFFIGTAQPDGRVKVVQRITGARPVDQFAKVLDDLLSGTGRARK